MTRRLRVGCGLAPALLGLSVTAFAQTNTQPAKPRARTAAVSTTPSLIADTVLVTGLPSIVEYPDPFLRNPLGKPEPRCVDFFVRSFERVTPRLHLTSTGMGGARLLDLSRGSSSPSCAASRADARTSIVLSNVGGAEHPVRLILPFEAFPRAEGGATGRLLLLRTGKLPSEVTLTLQQEDYGPFVRGFLWFFGVLLPALLTAGLGLVVYRLQKTWDVNAGEAEELDRFRKDKAGDLKQFFEGLYQTTIGLPQPADFVSTMERELADRRILFALPRKVRERLLAALRKGNREIVCTELAKAFPDHGNTILKSLQRGI